MVDLEGQALESTIVDGNETAEIREYFENEIERHDAIIDQGYLYSGANEAFLTYIDISTIRAVEEDSIDIPRKKGEVGICLTGIDRPVMTDKNFEWIVGADVRKAWAKDSIDDLDETGILKDEEFIAYNELMYADAWCHVAKGITAGMPNGGQEINESVFADLADQMILDAKEIGPDEEDTISRINIAQDSYDKGRFGAAIFDAAYVLAMEEAYDAIDSGMELQLEVDLMTIDKPDSLWGQVYYSHAIFLNEMNETSAAYRTLMLAWELDEAVGRMEAAIEPAQEVSALVEEKEEKEHDFIFYGIILSLFLLIIVILLIWWESNGTSRKRYRKANRTKQKKGRA